MRELFPLSLLSAYRSPVVSYFSINSYLILSGSSDIGVICLVHKLLEQFSFQNILIQLLSVNFKRRKSVIREKEL